MESPGGKANQIQPKTSEEDLERESKDIVPPSERKIMQLKAKNQQESSEEIKFSTNSKSRVSKSQSPKKKRQSNAKNSKKFVRVSFNEQINKVHTVENWKTYNVENSKGKINCSHCCKIM